VFLYSLKAREGSGTNIGKEAEGAAKRRGLDNLWKRTVLLVNKSCVMAVYSGACKGVAGKGSLQKKEIARGGGMRMEPETENLGKNDHRINTF